MFNFGKALDAMADGGLVRRNAWPPDVALMLVPAHLTDPPPQVQRPDFNVMLEEAEFMIVETPQSGAIRSVWSARTPDLLAEDWEYVT